MGEINLRMFDKVCTAGIFFALIFSVVGAFAQSDEGALDPSGWVTKYDTSFTGIGPKVYVLPPPRSREEVLVDSYQEKKGFYDSIARQLDFQGLLEEYQFTSNANYLEKTYAPFPKIEHKWDSLITSLEQKNNLPLVAGLSNEYAYRLAQSGNFQKAIQVLQRGLNAARQANSGERYVLEHNLANSYVFTGEFKKAANMQEAFLQRATDRRATSDQGNALVRIALVQAYGKAYRAAENMIIRRAFPIFNKNKNHHGKINALITLSKVYQLQNKHTEAQWFLIQARDLGRERKIEEDLPEIEYMLAFSKYVQQNYSVAQAEFEKAKQLAGDEDNRVLQLAISDKLGDIYLWLENYQGAEEELQEYWRLRNELFENAGVVN
ncbi:MAG: tetratricopeptide repeat protein [Sphingobacterium sp.]